MLCIDLRALGTEAEYRAGASQMTVVVESAPAAELVRRSDRLTALYRAVFAVAPYWEPPEAVAKFADRLRLHAEEDDFRGVLALDGDEVVGVAYGYRGAPGQWWHDVVRRELAPGVAARWLDDTCEIVQIAVQPDAQGNGIGGRLHDVLVASIPTRTAVLTTSQMETAATQLYRSRGWTKLHHRLVFPGGAVAFSVYGLELSARPEHGLAGG